MRTPVGKNTVLLLLGAGVVLLGSVFPQEIYDAVTLKRVHQTFNRRGDDVQGYQSFRRFGPAGVRHGLSEYYYVESGGLAGDSFYRNGAFVRGTNWSTDGRVKSQLRMFDQNGNAIGKGEFKSAPPWWWGVTDR